MQLNSKIEAFFLDRDGTINIDTGYIDSPENLRLIPGAATAIKKLNEAHIPVIVVTNQSGIARGFYDEPMLKKIHEKLDQLLELEDAKISDYFYCPHHPEGEIAEFKKQCQCRKPRPGMLHQGANKWQVELVNCVMIGDKSSDLEAGLAVSCQSVLVRTGNGIRTEKKINPALKEKVLIFDSLLPAVNYFLNE